MTLPTTQPINGTDDDSDIFGPPRSDSGYHYHHQRSRVPMISPKLRLREERKRILQLCAHKLERIKDSEANLRRSVCINNTYSRLTDEVRREKQNRYWANLPKSEIEMSVESSDDNIFSSCNGSSTRHLKNENISSNGNSAALRNNNNREDEGVIDYHNSNDHFNQLLISNSCNNNNSNCNNYNNRQIDNSISNATQQIASTTGPMVTAKPTCGGAAGNDADERIEAFSSCNSKNHNISSNSDERGKGLDHHHHHHHHHHHLHDERNHQYNSNHNQEILPVLNEFCSSAIMKKPDNNNSNNNNNSRYNSNNNSSRSRRSFLSKSQSVDADLEILDRELSAISASMPLIDPEITQGAEQLEKAVSSRKRSRSDDENDRLVREALSQFYLPTQRLISAIDDCPLDVKRMKSCSMGNVGSGNNNINNSNIIGFNNSTLSGNDFIGDFGDLGLDLNPSQKEFEVIMDALRLSNPSPTASDSCGQAAMMSESGVFHNLVVTSLET